MSKTAQRQPGPIGMEVRLNSTEIPSIIGANRGALGSEAYSSTSYSLEFQAIEIDIDKAYHFFYVCCFQEKMDENIEYRDFFLGLDEIRIPRANRIRIEAQDLANKVLNLYIDALNESPATAQNYVNDARRRFEKAKRSIQAKFDKLSRENKQASNNAGTAIKTLALIEFASTVTIKIVKNLTGPVGAAIDITYETLVEGIDTYASTNQRSAANYSLRKEKAFQGTKMALLKLGEETGKEALETANEKAINILAKNTIDATSKAVSDNKQQIKSLKSNMQKAKRLLGSSNKVTRLKALKEITNLMEQNLKLDKASKLLSANSSITKIGAKAAGNVVNVVFIADDIIGAWDKLQKRFETQQNNQF